MTRLPLQRPGSAEQILELFRDEPAQILSRCCLFLDLDGTLIEFMADPGGTVADAELTTLLQSALEKFSGALALVSGRLLATLDSILSPLRLPASGLYGLERRDPRGVVHRKAASAKSLDAVRATIAEFAAAHHGVITEDKGTAIALHYRQAPALGADCRRIIYGAAAGLWPQFQVIEGSMVAEIVPAGASKATAIEEFLLEPPFKNRIPIAVGDDYSDSEAFTAVHRHGGLAVAVGHRVHGDQCLEDWQAARRWLSTLIGSGP
jgi:trehalose 6-phosphate phosphatase